MPAVRAIRLMVKEGRAQAAVSAGNTGALMAISKFVLKTLPGIDRPAIASILPTVKGHTYVLDLGANVDCTSEHLFQFGLMNDAPVTVSAFTCEVIAERALFVAGEGYAAPDQPFDRPPAVLDHETGGIRVTQAGAGDQGVAQMSLDRILAVKYCRHTALRPA